jgi:hypothetical protein
LGSSTVKSFASIDFIFNGKSSHEQGDERGGHCIYAKGATSTKIRFEGEGSSKQICVCSTCGILDAGAFTAVAAEWMRHGSVVAATHNTMTICFECVVDVFLF